MLQKIIDEGTEGWGIDDQGTVTTNPSEVLHGGALMPLGGIDLMRGYKGYGLSLMVDIFSGVLSGSAFGTNVDIKDGKHIARTGHFFAARLGIRELFFEQFEFGGIVRLFFRARDLLLEICRILQKRQYPGMTLLFRLTKEYGLETKLEGH